ncbi:unnamed protein product, partial [Mesorhabditis belari]|uniref:Actin-related protein 6 n=1 Tax=Mesorhabditis belari TaxID=2138241 RepID=A0AAF3F1L1_9BILA
MKTLVVDNGGYSIKIGYADGECRTVPNAVFKSRTDRKRAYISDQLDELNERTGLFYSLPCERGYLVNWDIQRQIWEHLFTGYQPSETRIALSDPIYTVPAINDYSGEILFEDFGFSAVHKSAAPRWIGCAAAAVSSSNRLCLVVDSGYSFTHVVPLLDGQILQSGVLRIDVGGKVLTNLLKEWISYREINMREETYVVNECKEDCCYVSIDFDIDMKISRLKNETNTIRREYVLPDFRQNMRGFVRNPVREKDDLQKVSMNLERFSLPEVLFKPNDIGIDQLGIGEAVVESTKRIHEHLAPGLLQNIYVVGGSSLFPNFRQRLEREVRSGAPDLYGVGLASIPNPITHAWTSGAMLAKSDELPGGFMTRTEYLECGEDFMLEQRFLEFNDDPDYAEYLTNKLTKATSKSDDAFVQSTN